LTEVWVHLTIFQANAGLTYHVSIET
jgi:hypothetical protein